MKTKITILIAGIFVFFSSPLYGQYSDSLSAVDLYDLSLEELLNVKITTGSLSPSSVKNAISPITIITKEQIQITQARNIATLLEIYVPGMMLMTHQEGDKIGLRGLIAAENYKLLLLLNGKNITNTTYEGAFLELDQWDMNDIERIEIMRGPGSVTYGSGAIAGVINIITKNANKNTTLISTGVAYNPVYRSYGGNVQFSDKYGKLGVYLHSSIRRSSGQDNPNYYRPSPNNTTDVRFLGKKETDITGPQSHLADVLDRPQVKVHLDINYGDNFKIWTRYTQSGQTHYFTNNILLPNSEGDTVLVDNPRSIALRSFAVAPEFKHRITEKVQLLTNVTYDNQEYNRIRVTSAEHSVDHYINARDYAFSQERIIANILLDFDYNKFVLIGGYQFNRTAVKAPWGKGADHLWIFEGVNIISDTNSSVYYTNPNSQLTKRTGDEQVGAGIFVNTHSLLLESSYEFSEKLKLHHASRLDFPDISATMYSPRISLISEINNRNIIKLSAQKSLRMMPLRAQYLYNKYIELDTTSNKSEHEVLNSLEISYIFVPKKNVLIEMHSYYNDINAVGFTGNDLQFLGDLQLFGFDLEASFKREKSSFIINHSFLHLINMNMNEELKTGGNRNNISFSDYDYKTRGTFPLSLKSYGNGLNNISNNSTRFIFTQKLLQDKLIVQANSRIYWDYKGSYDEMHMYSEAYNNYDISTLTTSELDAFNEQKAAFKKEKELLEESGAYKPDFKINMSITYKWRINEKTNLLTTIYSYNLIGTTKRYYVSTGSRNYYPERLRFIEEPRTLGLKLQLNFK